METKEFRVRSHQRRESTKKKKGGDVLNRNKKRGQFIGVLFSEHQK